MKSVLITGATGYIGSRFLRSILQTTDAQVHLLARPWKDGDRSTKLAAQWDPKRVKIHVIETRDVGKLSSLQKDIDTVIHSAAATRFNITEQEGRDNNTEPTRALVEFAQGCPKLDNFLFTSTVYASGKMKGVIEETELNPSEFANFYEKSKFECERLITASKLPWQIQRIATAVADNEAGQVSQFNAVHNTLKLFYFGLISLVPGEPQTPVYLVNGDFVVESMRQIAAKGPRHEFFHVCQPMAQNLKLGEVLDLAFQIYSNDAKFKSRRVLKPLYADLDSFRRLAKGLGDFNSGILGQAIGSIAPFAEQLYVPKDIRVDKARKFADVSFPDQKKTLENALQTLMQRQFQTQDGGPA